MKQCDDTSFSIVGFKMQLNDYAANTYSQFGEDGIIAHLFQTIGIESAMCVEFGAGDGNSCSNTKALWRDQGWKALLIEPDVERFESLEGETHAFNATCLRMMLEPTGTNSIDQILMDHEIHEIDFMSIDIDGDDYFIFEKMACRPRVVCIEFNPTIPPHIEVRQEAPGGTFGASLLAMVRLGQTYGYMFVGASYCNAFFVERQYADKFTEYETAIDRLFSPANYTYAVTDYAGRIVLVGQVLPWEAKDPYVRPLVASTYVTMASNSVQQIRRGFEGVWGPGWWLTPDGLSPERLETLFKLTEPVLVCIDLTNADLGSVQWMWDLATSYRYQTMYVGKVLGLVREGH